MHWPGFCGPSYQARSMNVAAERSINFFPVVAQSGTPKVKTWLVGTPGLKGFVNLGSDISGPVRGLFQQNGRAFAVVGQNFYEFFPSGRAVQWGDVTPDSRPAKMFSNGTAGNQILILSGGYLTLFNTATNGYVQTEHWPDADLPQPLAGIAFLDGYFLAVPRNSRRIYISAREDGLDWDALDWDTIATAGDNLRAVATSHRELWLFGEHTGHVWYDSGNQDFPFQPVSGVQIEHGILAPDSLVNLDNTLFWVGSSPQGVGVVWRANGYTPQRISTDAVEYWLQSYSHLDRAIGYAYQEEGHAFYVLWIPMSGRETTTWVYDVSCGLWHERATWNEDHLHWEPHEGRCHCYAFGRHFLGSATSGQIYHQSLDYYDEDLRLLETSVVRVSASVSRSASRSGSSSYSGSASESGSSSRSSSRSASVSSSRSASGSGSASQSPSASESASSSLSESLSESASASAEP